MSYPQFLRHLARLRHGSYVAALAAGLLLGLLLTGMVSGIVAAVAGVGALVFALLGVWTLHRVRVLRSELEALIRS